MNYFAYRDYCLLPYGGSLPGEAVPTQEPFEPLVILVHREPAESGGIYRVSSLSQVEPEGLSPLFPQPGLCISGVERWIQKHGACVLNTAFLRAFDVLEGFLSPKREALRLTVVGLGDVGGTLLTGLKLLSGKTVSEIGIYDPNEALCRRYEAELNQVLPVEEGLMPKVVCREFDSLFDCDAFLFTASRGVPPVGTQGVDVRMEQFEKNREMLRTYAKMARDSRFSGLFFQISDPVDLLARSVFWQTNTDAQGAHDFGGLLPEQIQGCGLGVMAARAAYMAERSGIDFSNGTVYGPHGKGLAVINDKDHYDPQISQLLTKQTVEANLEIRELGFKPYIAPGLSSACASVLRALRGQWHYGTAPIGGVCFGCKNRYTRLGLETERLDLDPAARLLLENTWLALKERETECRK